MEEKSLVKQRIIPLAADEMLEKFNSENWEGKFAASERSVRDKEISLDNHRTTTKLRRITCENQSHRAVWREFRLSDGTPKVVPLELEDESGIYRYNGIVR